MHEPIAAAAWRVERYRDGDEHQVLDLLRTVFGKARSLEHWVVEPGLAHRAPGGWQTISE